MKLRINGIPIKYFFLPKYWKSYLRGKIIGDSIKQEYIEQLIDRMTTPGCSECLRLGKCTECGCNTFEKMLDPHSECAKVGSDGMPLWGPMVSKGGWEDVKRTIGLEFYKRETKVKDGK